MMVAGTAAAVGVALTASRRLSPAFVEASPAPRPAVTPIAIGATLGMPNPWPLIGKRFVLAGALALAGIVLVAAVAAAGTIIVQRATFASSTSSVYGPSAELRAAAGMSGGYEQAYSAAYPSADAVGGTLLAAAEERHAYEVLQALKQIDEQRKADAAAQAARASAQPARGVAGSLNKPSGYAAGTIIHGVRITIYGCVGPGGGFCNGMASGIQVFEGAAACSSDLPFGTKVRIHGDPTGRVYECLDRGALASTWVDVFFYDTSAGIAWQSLLGGTVADVEIVN